MRCFLARIGTKVHNDQPISDFPNAGRDVSCHYNEVDFLVFPRHGSQLAALPKIEDGVARTRFCFTLEER